MSESQFVNSGADTGFLKRGFICIKVFVCVCVGGGGGHVAEFIP